MNTIGSLESGIQQQWVGTPASAGATTATTTNRRHRLGVETFVSLVCLAAITSVIVCICISNLNLSRSANPVARTQKASAATTAAATLTQNAGVTAAATIPSAPRQHTFSSAVNASQAAALPGLQPTSQTSVWSMVGMGFLLLIARCRTFGPMTK